MNKKGIAPVLILVLGLVALLVANQLGYVNLNVASITGSGSYVERPVFKYVKCEAIGGLKYSEFTNIDGWAIQPNNGLLSSYNLKVRDTDSTGLVSTKKLTYSICNSRVNSKANCRIYNQEILLQSKGQVVEINNIKGSEVVNLDFKKLLFNAKATGEYQIGFIPYGLREYDVLSGSANQVNPNSCIVPTNADSWKDRFISSNADKVQNTISKNTNERTLQPEEVRWYLSGYVTSAEPSFKLKYLGKDAWCRTTGNTGEIYEINTVTVGSGTYKIASADWSDNLGSVGCCPGQTRGDSVCNDKFKYVSIKGSTPGDFGICGSPNYVPYSEKQVVRYKKDSNGICTQKIKDVECASDFDCKDTNGLCDLNSFECVNPATNLDGQKIETIADNDADCSSKGGTWKKKTTQDKKWYNFIGIGEPEVIVEEYCDTSAPNYLLWIILIISGIALIYFLKPILGIIRGLLRF